MPSDLEKMYEQSFSGMGYFKPGQVVNTEVVSISNDCLFLQLNGKSEGILDRAELTDKEGKLSVKVGDKLRVFFLNAENGEMHFTTKISGNAAGAKMLVQAYLEKIPVEGLVEKETKGGYEVKIGEFRAFCPYSKMGERRSDNPAEYVGKNLNFKIQEFKDNGRSILVSNRVIYEEAHQERLEALKKTLHEGMVITGSIKSIQSSAPSSTWAASRPSCPSPRSAGPGWRISRPSCRSARKSRLPSCRSTGATSASASA